VLVAVGHRDRDRTQPLRREAGDALTGAQVHAPEGLAGEPDVAAHREPDAVEVVFADVDAGDVGAGDRRHVTAHRRQDVLERLFPLAEGDQPKDPVERAVSGVVDLETERAVFSLALAWGHSPLLLEPTLSRDLFPAFFGEENCFDQPKQSARGSHPPYFRKDLTFG
jgi:hypothetical protein